MGLSCFNNNQSRYLIYFMIKLLIKIFIIQCCTSSLSSGNDAVINKCKEYKSVFTGRVIDCPDGNGRIFVIDKIILGEVNSLMMKHSQTDAKMKNLRTKKMIFMFYPKGRKEYEMHTIDSKGGFDFRIDGKPEYCVVSDLINGLK
jgi:hypothetical protein